MPEMNAVSVSAHCRRRLAAFTAALGLTLLPAMTAATSVLAAEHGGGEGGGNSCPWASDTTVNVGGRDMIIPQAVFDQKTQQMNIDGYEVVPAIHQLILRFFGPYGDVWEASLTRIDGGKRCIAFMVGTPVQTAEAVPYSQRKTASKGGKPVAAVVASPAPRH